MNQKETAVKQYGFSEGVLDPISRTSEILFGLIMVLTFTCSLSAASAGRSDIREMLLGALGCNLAWGIIDAFFYLLGIAAEKGREQLLISKLRDVKNQESARTLFQNILPQSILGSLSATSFKEISEHLLKNQTKKPKILITFSDLRACFTVFALVFLSTFPVAVPFLIISEPMRALRISNLIALILLFTLGYSLGRYAGRYPWIWGIGMTVIGSVLVSVTIALGG